PRPIVEKLNGEIKKVLEHPDVEKNLVAQTLDPMYMSVDEFAARMKADYEKYDKLVKTTGAKMEAQTVSSGWRRRSRRGKLCFMASSPRARGEGWGERSSASW